MVVAFFDFDNTLVKKDSLLAFLKHYFSFSTLVLKSILFLPSLLQYKLKLIDNSEAKERLFKCFFKNEQQFEFENKAKRFSIEWIPKNLNLVAMEKLQWHLKKKHKVFIVTASISDYIQPWCTKNNILLISTELEKINNIITGSFSTNNCYGPEKVNRIKEVVDLNKVKSSYAYGDSEGDLQMLELVEHSFYRAFE